MILGPENSHEHATDVRQPDLSVQSDSAQFNWRIHHPFEGKEGSVAVEVGPWKGLLPRWRFVIPGDFKGVTRWGVGPAATGEISEDVKRPVKDGPLKMVNGPVVSWFGGHEPLSSRQSAYLVFEGEPPHYVAFGQAEVSGGPPSNLEGISFGNDHPAHPDDLDISSHHHEPVHLHNSLDHSTHNQP